MAEDKKDNLSLKGGKGKISTIRGDQCLINIG